jgi:hypothetical protein
MATLKLIQFSGEIPRIIPRLLPETASQQSENVRLDDGGLTPIRKLRLEHTFDGYTDIKTIYKNGDEWLAWETVVNATPGPVAQDRLYYTGDGVPKMRVDGTVYPLAVTAPTTALTATLSGTGTGDVITRIYVYTWVTDFSEESEPCPASNEVDWQSGMTTTLSGFASPPTGRGITKQRIYRSQSSSSGGTDFYLIAERTASTSSFTDTVGIEDYSEVLPSTDWNAPPDDLTGIISLPNGMMAAFVGKDLYICEPFRPHAWPEKYVMTMEYDIVALGAYGTNIVVMTTGQPYIVNGIAPESMVQEKLELNLPCINARGVVDLGYSVAYPSYDGLVVVSGGQAVIGTESLMTRTNWLKTSPATYVAAQYNGRYFASYSYLDADGTEREGTFIFDLTGQTPFILRGASKADCCFYDITTSSLYMLIGDYVFEWDAIGNINEIMTWKSKQFVLPTPVSFGAVYIESQELRTKEQDAAIKTEIAAIKAENETLFAEDSIGGEINGSMFNTYPINGDALTRLYPEEFVIVSIYADGELVATISDPNTVVRMPAVRARRWEVKVNGTLEVAEIDIASTARELNSI